MIAAIHLNAGELLALLVLFFGLIWLSMYVRDRVRENREAREAVNQLMNEANASELIKLLKKQGYIFPNLFTIQDLYSNANRMGIRLTAVDAWRIANTMVKEFNPEVGLSGALIRDAIRRYMFELDKEID